MKRTCLINGAVGQLEVRNEEPGEVSVLIGTIGRTVKGSELSMAVQNARNTGHGEESGLSVTCQIKVVGGDDSFLLLKSVSGDSKKVAVIVDDKELIVGASDLLEAVTMCSRN